jgi:hypothetical protein
MRSVELAPERPVAFRPCLTAGLAFVIGLKTKKPPKRIPGGFIMALSGKPASKISCFEQKR